MMRLLRRAPVVLALAALLVLAACGSSGGGTAGDAGAGAAPVRGGSMTMIAAGGFNTWPNLDPAVPGTANADPRNAIYGELFHQGPNGEIQPGLASGFTTAPDGKSVTVQLRPGLMFSDNTPLNAEAAVWNMKRALDPATACPCASLFNMVTSVTADGADKVVLALKAPYPPLVPAFINTAMNWMASPTAFQQMGAADFGQKPIGAGPFKVVSNVASQKLELERNPTYWQTDRPYLDKLTFQAAANDDAAYAAVQSGSGDVISGLTSISVLTQAKAQFQVVPIPPIASWHLQFNTESAPLNDVRARQALIYATDTDSLVKFVSNGLFEPSQSPGGDGGLFHDNQVPGTEGFDLAKATDLVKQLGGLKVTIGGFGPGQGQTQTTAEAIQSMWKKAGIDATISPAPLATVLENYKSGNWSVNLGFSGAIDPALRLGVDYYFASTGPNSGVADPDLDKIITEAGSSSDTSKRGQLYTEAYERIAQESYATFLYQNNTFYIARKTVQGLDQNSKWLAWQDVSVSK